MANAAQQLQEAYQQIENGNLQEARQLLEEIRPQNENNPDFWWVYAHALEDESDGRNALSRVRQLAPNYPGLQDVEEQAGIRVAPSQIQPLQRLGSSPTDEVFDDLDDLDAEFDDLEDDEETSGDGLRNILVGVGGFVVILVIIFIILAISGIFGGGGTPEPTKVVAQNTPQVANTEAATDAITATEEPSDEPTEELSTATVEPTTEEPTELIPTATNTETLPTNTPEPTEVTDPFAALYEGLAAFGVPDDGISYEATSLGNSLVVDTCANPGPTANNNIIGIMDVFAAANLEIPEDVEAITFNINNCDANTTTLILGVERDAFSSYLAGETSQSDLLQAIQRVG